MGLIASAFGLKILLGMNTGVAAVGLLIGMYSVAVYGSGRLRVFFLALAGLGFVAGFVVFAITGNPRSFALSVPSLAHAAACCWATRAERDGAAPVVRTGLPIAGGGGAAGLRGGGGHRAGGLHGGVHCRGGAGRSRSRRHMTPVIANC